jgi:hypothetical protein
MCVVYNLQAFWLHNRTLRSIYLSKKPSISLRILPQHDRQFYALDPTVIRLVSTKFCLTVVLYWHFTKGAWNTYLIHFQPNFPRGYWITLNCYCIKFVVYLQTFFASWCWLNSIILKLHLSTENSTTYNWAHDSTY